MSPPSSLPPSEPKASVPGSDQKQHRWERAAFLTTEANREVGQVHPKAMPLILRTKEQFEPWLSSPLDEALALQRPLPD